MLRVSGMWSDDVYFDEQCWSCSVERLFRGSAAFLTGNIPRNLLIHNNIGDFCNYTLPVLRVCGLTVCNMESSYDYIAPSRQ